MAVNSHQTTKQSYPFVTPQTALDYKKIFIKNKKSLQSNIGLIKSKVRVDFLIDKLNNYTQLLQYNKEINNKRM